MVSMTEVTAKAATVSAMIQARAHERGATFEVVPFFDDAGECCQVRYERRYDCDVETSDPIVTRLRGDDMSTANEQAMSLLRAIEDVIKDVSERTCSVEWREDDWGVCECGGDVYWGDVYCSNCGGRVRGRGKGVA